MGNADKMTMSRRIAISFFCFFVVIGCLICVLQVLHVVDAWLLPITTAKVTSYHPHLQCSATRPETKNIGDSRLQASSSEEQGSVDEVTNHLILVGTHLKVIDDDFGDAIIRAGEAWSLDWSQVAESFGEASTAINNAVIPSSLEKTFQNIAQEMEDISTIEGCTSVGPAASIPNFMQIQQCLNDAAAALSQQEEEDNDKHLLHNALKQASIELEALIESI